TNSKSSTTLKYGTDKNNLNQEVQSPWGGSPHRVTVKNLKPSTTYYFKVMDANAQNTGTKEESNVFSFTTMAKGATPDRANKNVGTQGEPTREGPVTASTSLPQSDQPAKADVQITNGPVLNGIYDNKAVISWSTNSSSSATIKYGTDQSNLTQQAQSPWGS